MNDCEPFSQCWCEKHPNGHNHPKCVPELEIGGFVFNSIFFICFLVFLMFKKGQASKTIKKHYR